VSGFVESGYQGSGGGYYGTSGRELPPGRALPSGRALPAPTTDYASPGYGESASHAQPWDYSQPLRYDGEEPTYLGAGHPSGPYATLKDGYVPDSFTSDSYASDYSEDSYAGYDEVERYSDYSDPARGNASQASASPYDRGGSYGGAASYDDDPRSASSSHRPSYDPNAYNGSDLSRPGVDGLGYDLSEIIGTRDFPQYGYDEPSVERLSYDDPRYEDGYGEASHDGTRFDETRLDNFWPGGGGRRGAGRDSGTGPHRAYRPNDTRLDLGYRTDQTRFDVPAYGSFGDETRMDGMRALSADPNQGRAATSLLAPPEFAPSERSLNWADETSLDSFSGLDLDEPPLGYRGQPSRAVETAMREVPLAPPGKANTGGQRTVGRRRGRSSDRRQWLALGAVVVVAAGAITGVLSKFVFAGPSGPAHSISTPASLDSYTRSASLEKAVNVDGLREKIIQSSSGQASDVVDAVYAQGSVTPGAGGSGQMFMFVGGHLANTDPASSITTFEQAYPNANVVYAGPLGGKAACATTANGGESLSMCVWFDNDSFGTLVSPSMSTAKLASTMVTVRPGLEQVAK
jgi:hypothetical protein